MISALPEFLSDPDRREALIVRPLRLLSIILLALLARAILNRAIRRLVRSTASEVPVVLRPLRNRPAVNGLLESAGLVSERRRQRAETIGSILRSAGSIIIALLALMLILEEFEFRLGPFIAGAGIVGVALGFGAQNVVKDFLSGIFILLEDQYGVGDVVDLGEANGVVEGVGLRTTRLRDVNGTVWYVRNGEILRVGNRSQGYGQVVLDVPLPYSADVERASRIIEAVADGLVEDEDWADAVLEDPQLLGIEQLTEDGVVLRLTVKTRPPDQWRVARELRRRLKQRLDADRIRADAEPHEVHIGGAGPPAPPGSPAAPGPPIPPGPPTAPGSAAAEAQPGQAAPPGAGRPPGGDPRQPREPRD